MTTRLIIDPLASSFRDLTLAAEALLDGGLIAGPTQSYYAFMALADKPKALERLSQLKFGRSPDQPFLLLIDSNQRAACYARETNETARLLMAHFWPGLLTILFLAHTGLNSLLLGKANTVGLRVEGLSLVRNLIRMVDRGLTGTSANRHKSRPPTTAGEVIEAFDGQIDLIIDAGQTLGQASSTIVDVSGPEPWIFRAGAIPPEDVLAVCPNLKFS
ncbi:MAG: threonylcarbamoyl-AMP synthase [Deltaproteobacteria bacterium]|nr:threonylcarbamoyl-AMP synthase [Deltaproteobacteria bacterium]